LGLSLLVSVYFTYIRADVPGSIVLAGAVAATEKETSGFDAVPDDPAAAAHTRRRYGIKGTLEAVEDLGLTAKVQF